MRFVLLCNYCLWWKIEEMSENEWEMMDYLIVFIKGNLELLVLLIFLFNFIVLIYFMIIIEMRW